MRQFKIHQLNCSLLCGCKVFDQNKGCIFINIVYNEHGTIAPGQQPIHWSTFPRIYISKIKYFSFLFYNSLLVKAIHNECYVSCCTLENQGAVTFIYYFFKNQTCDQINAISVSHKYLRFNFILEITYFNGHLMIIFLVTMLYVCKQFSFIKSCFFACVIIRFSTKPDILRLVKIYTVKSQTFASYIHELI